MSLYLKPVWHANMYKLTRLIHVCNDVYFYNMHGRPINLVQYDTIEEFKVDSKAEYSD